MPERDLEHFLVRLWWVQLPRAAGRVSTFAASSLSDGLYLTAWPRIAAAAPSLSLLAGLLAGWLHPGFADVFSESISLTVVAAVLGIMSGHMGMLFLAGFVVGDFFLAHLTWTSDGSLLRHLLRIRLPLAIQYSLLAIATTAIPVWTKTLLALLRLPPALSRRTRFGIAMMGHAALTYAMVYFWVRIVPLLIRPVFTWREVEVPLSALSPIQQHTGLLLLAAVVASLVRMSLQAAVAFDAPRTARLDAWQSRLVEAPPRRTWRSRVSPGIRAAGRSLLVVLFLGGVFQSWVEGAILGLLIFALRMADTGVDLAPLRRWRLTMSSVPWLLRVVSALLLFYLASSVVIPWRMPFAAITGLALLIFFLLVPAVSQVPAATEQRVT